jgi:hypothetical protein
MKTKTANCSEYLMLNFTFCPKTNVIENKNDGEYPQKCVIKDIDLFDFQIHVLKC